jgi:trehalose/maltose transport system permease protein
VTAASKTSRISRERVRSAWLFLAPMLIVLALVAAWPLLRTIFFSFTNATLVDMSRYAFVGLSNYLSYDGGRWYGVLTDPQWLLALRNTVLFAVISVTLETVLGVGIAVMLNQSFPGRGLMRAALLVPWAIPTVVSAKMWAWMLNDQFGIVNDALMRLGAIDQPVAWLADPHLAMASVILVDVWKTTPFVALLTLAALQMLPKDCYEAARVDGIHPVRVFLQVTLPLIRPALAVAVIFRLLDAMRMFDLVYIMTGSTDATMTLSVFARRELVGFEDVGYGSTASTLLFLVIALMTVAYLMAMRPDLDGKRR